MRRWWECAAFAAATQVSTLGMCMRLVSLRSGTDTHAGLLLGEHVLDLTAAAIDRPDWADLPRSVRGILSGGDDIRLGWRIGVGTCTRGF
jgi:hypothetical protein